MKKYYQILFVILIFFVASASFAQEAVWPDKTTYKTVMVGKHKIFYREAGDPQNPTILLLHGYPSSSHTYREMIPLLSGRFHVIAPDNLGSGYSAKPAPDETTYTFDLLAEVTAGFIDALALERYSIYMQDFGAPVGYRLSKLKPAPSAKAYSTGIPCMDEHYKMRPGDLTVVTGIPSHGKSTWVNDLCCHMAENHGWMTAFQ